MTVTTEGTWGRQQAMPTAHLGLEQAWQMDELSSTRHTLVLPIFLSLPHAGSVYRWCRRVPSLSLGFVQGEVAGHDQEEEAQGRPNHSPQTDWKEIVARSKQDFSFRQPVTGGEYIVLSCLRGDLGSTLGRNSSLRGWLDSEWAAQWGGGVTVPRGV